MSRKRSTVSLMGRMAVVIVRNGTVLHFLHLGFQAVHGDIGQVGVTLAGLSLKSNRLSEPIAEPAPMFRLGMPNISTRYTRRGNCDRSILKIYDVWYFSRRQALSALNIMFRYMLRTKSNHSHDRSTLAAWGCGKNINKMAGDRLCDLSYTHHAKDRIDERNLIISDIQYVLKHGISGWIQSLRPLKASTSIKSKANLRTLLVVS